MKELTYIGKSYPVQDAAAKATGELLYVDDMTMPRMLYAKALFSPVAHARIKRIDTTAAEALPGVVRVITAADIPGENKVGHLKHDQYSLIPIGGLTHYLGDAIALVVAETPEIL